MSVGPDPSFALLVLAAQHPMVMVMVMVFIYRIFYMHIQMRFKLLQCKGEIGHKLCPLATSSNPPNPRIIESRIKTRPAHRKLHALLHCTLDNVIKATEQHFPVVLLGEIVYESRDGAVVRALASHQCGPG